MHGPAEPDWSRASITLQSEGASVRKTCYLLAALALVTAAACTRADDVTATGRTTPARHDLTPGDTTNHAAGDTTSKGGYIGSGA